MSFEDINHTISEIGEIQCKDDSCDHPNCKYIKENYLHFKDNIYSKHDCDDCDVMNLFIQQHSINCTNDDCKIPMCVNYKICLNHIESISKFNSTSNFNIKESGKNICISTEECDGKTIFIKHEDFNNRTKYVKNLIAHQKSIKDIEHVCGFCEILEIYRQQHALHCYEENCDEINCIYYRLFYNHVEELENSKRFSTPVKKRKFDEI